MAVVLEKSGPVKLSLIESQWHEDFSGQSLPDPSSSLLGDDERRNYGPYTHGWRCAALERVKDYALLA